MQLKNRHYLISLSLMLALTACGPSGGSSQHTNTNVNDNTNGNNNNTGPCVEGTKRCDTTSTMVEVCTNGVWSTDMVCSNGTPQCYQGACVVCIPNQVYCQDNKVLSCNADGSASTELETCDPLKGDTCVAGACVSACQQAEKQNSYIGCDYWPTPVANTALNDVFSDDFAVVVHNDNADPATVTITKGGSQVDQQQVAPHEIKTIKLAYDATLKGDLQQPVSVIAPDGAYHLVSTLPVTVYQFNPLDFQVPRECQVGLETENPCHSYSNDASLLLPSHVLSNHYMIMSRPTFGVDTGWGMGFIPGFFAVIATADNTTVTITFSANTQAGSGGQIQTYSPGQQAQFQLNQGQVLQILSAVPTDCGSGETSSDDCNGQGGSCTYCNMGPTYDLSGTVVESTAPVSVFSGHICDFVPYNYWACDHLEEQMIPSEAWGKDFIVARTKPQSPDTPEPNLVKILSRENDNTITFDPASIHDSVTLNAGEYVEFTTTEDFHVTAVQPMMVAQFLVGQNFYTNNLDYWGDPAMALVVPFEQYRAQYTFLNPDTITYNYVSIVAKVGETGENVSHVTLDGTEVDFSGAMRIGQTLYGSVQVDLSNAPTSFHSITGTEPFGIMVYGFARYTSYFYPGGLNLEYINPIE
ncbi:MAG: IgGFc-binding protein [Deltaproteobacteria bacterium]|nr:IgGFc-binding protein [Deltaproteobacteria bacterium]